MSSSGRRSPKVSKAGVQKGNWISAGSRSWLRCPSERFVPVTCWRPFRAPQTTGSATSRELLLFGERSQRSFRPSRAPPPDLPLTAQVSQFTKAALRQPQFFPPSADAPTELLTQTAVKCSSFHWTASIEGADQAVSSAQSSLGSIINGVRMAANKRGEGTESSASTTTTTDRGLFGAQNCVFGCLGDAEFDHPFCSNLDGFARCRIPTHASFAIHQNYLAQSRNREGVLRIFICQCNQSFQGLHGLFLCQANGSR